MWKITAKAIQKQPITGTGLGGFPAAYAEAQAEYMASGKATEQEKRIAGCPEYAFNEYLQIGLEQGVVGIDVSGSIRFLFLSIAIAGVLGSIDIPRGDERNTGQG